MKVNPKSKGQNSQYASCEKIAQGYGEGPPANLSRSSILVIF